MRKELALRHLLLVQGRELAKQDFGSPDPGEERARATLREMIDSLEVSIEGALGEEKPRTYRIRATANQQSPSLLANDADFSFYAQGEAARTGAPDEDRTGSENASHARAVWGVLLRLAGTPLKPEHLALPAAGSKRGAAKKHHPHRLEAALIAYFMAVKAITTFNPELASRGHLLALGALGALLAADLLPSAWPMCLAGAALALPAHWEPRAGVGIWAAGLVIYDLAALLAPWRTSKGKLACLHASAATALVAVCALSPPAGFMPEVTDFWFLNLVRPLLVVLSAVFWFNGTHLHPLRIFVPLYLLLACQLFGSALPEAPVAVGLGILWLSRFRRVAHAA